MPNENPPQQGYEPTSESKTRVITQTRRQIIAYIALLTTFITISSIQPECTSSSNSESSVSRPTYSKRFYNAKEFENISDDLMPNLKKKNPKRRNQIILYAKMMLKKYPNAIFDMNTLNVYTEYMQKFSLAFQDNEVLEQINPCDIDVKTIPSFKLMETAAENLTDAAEEIRSKLGVCLKLSSVFRLGITQEEMKNSAKKNDKNAIVGGSEHGVHIMGQAVDFNYVAYNTKQYREIIKILAKYGWHMTELGDCGHVEYRKPKHFTKSHKRTATTNLLPFACTSKHGRWILKNGGRPAKALIRKLRGTFRGGKKK